MGLLIALLLSLQETRTELQVQKGVLYLRSQHAELEKDREFALWTLATADVRRSDPLVRDLLKDMLARPPETTRSAALQILTLALLDPEQYRDRIAHGAQFLVDNQCADGRWDKGSPVEPPILPAAPPPPPPPKPRDFGGPPVRRPQKVQLLRRREGAREGDAVNSRWAAWGLLEAHNQGLLPPEDLPARAAGAWRTGDADPADVVACLSTHLYFQKKERKSDPDVLKALDRLAIRDRATDAQSLFLLKRAMFLYDSNQLGGREWWPEGVKILTAAQSADGSWKTVEESCWAVQYLHVVRFRWPDLKERR
jgi:hypothetical protein